MIRLALTKFLRFIATFLVAAVVIFVTLEVLPGDPARFMLGINATPEAVAALREQLGLDTPAWQRLVGWIGGLFVGNLGPSVAMGQPAGTLIAGALGVTIPLALMAMILSAGIGLPVGILAAQRRGEMAERAIGALVRFGIAVPSFWFGMLLVLLFAVTLRWVPPGGFVPWRDNAPAALASLVLPAIALALPQAAMLARATRTALLEVRSSDYIRTARAQGMTSQEAIRRHGLRNALLPVATILGVQFAWLIAGTMFVENVFYLPGLGRLIFDAIAAHDLVLVRGSVAVLVLAMTGTAFLADLVVALIDPRMRSWRSQ